MAKAAKPAKAKKLSAETLIALDRHDEADALLITATRGWAAYVGRATHPGQDNYFLLARARVALARGDAPAAAALLAQVQPSPGLVAGAADLALVERDVLLSHSAALQGRAAAACETAAGALLRLQPQQPLAPQPALQADALHALGLAQSQAQQPQAARASLQQALALRRGNDLAGSVWVRQLQADLASLSKPASAGPAVAAKRTASTPARLSAGR